MSVTVTKSEGVTVFTLTSDPQSPWPPLCQIFKGLCYSPACCSVPRLLRGAPGGSQSLLGTLQMMVGLLNIGLGTVLSRSGGGSGWQMDETGFPFWMGGLFLVFGIACVLSEKFPSLCLVIVTLILNLAGVAFAIAALVLYAVNIADIGLWWMCESEDEDRYRYDYEDHRVRPTVSPEELLNTQKCQEGKEILLFLFRSINAVLIVASVLQICVSISSAVLGIKAVKSRRHGDDKFPSLQSAEEPEKYCPLVDGGDGDGDPTA